MSLRKKLKGHSFLHMLTQLHESSSSSKLAAHVFLQTGFKQVQVASSNVKLPPQTFVQTNGSWSTSSDYWGFSVTSSLGQFVLY